MTRQAAWSAAWLAFGFTVVAGSVAIIALIEHDDDDRDASPAATVVRFVEAPATTTATTTVVVTTTTVITTAPPPTSTACSEGQERYVGVDRQRCELGAWTTVTASTTAAPVRTVPIESCPDGQERTVDPQGGIMCAPSPTPPPTQGGVNIAIGGGTAEIVFGPYYANCDEARAAGVTPIRQDQESYRRSLDGDGDGIACED